MPAKEGTAARRLARLLVRGRAGALSALLAAASCIAPGADVHLAPFYTNAATGDGRREVEALGGLFRERWRAHDGSFESLTIGPLYSLDDQGEGSWLSRLFVPLGYTSHRAAERRTTSLLFPFYLWVKAPKADGSNELRFAVLPGLLFRVNDQRGTEFGWFPFVGRFENFLGFDRIVFVLWPLFAYAESGGRVSFHYLYPILGWTRGGGETSHHLWPLYGKASIERRYERWYWLWPFFHFNRNNLGGGNEEPETKWLFFPFLGHSRRGTFRAWTVLWPLFGFSRDPRSGFWAWDGPFPLVRFQRGPAGVERSRVWPFYGHFRAPGIDSRSFLWPIVWIRREETSEFVRDASFVIPFWQRWTRRELASGERSSWTKLWPLFQLETRGDRERGSFPTLDPFQRNELVDRHFSWIWKLWEYEQEHELRRERSWLGLWRRERDAGEDRRSLAFLWSDRRFVEEGREVTETALLLGLLRWRVTKGAGFAILPPAFPGPGWPAERDRGEG